MVKQRGMSECCIQIERLKVKIGRCGTRMQKSQAIRQWM